VQRVAVRGEAGGGRRPARDRDGGQQSGVAVGGEAASGVDGCAATAGVVAIAANPGAFDRRSSRAATASASDVV
jgi:hypothetical protein